MRPVKPLWWMEEPLLEVRIDSIFSGRIIAVTRGMPEESICRSYDHCGHGYGWVPDRKDRKWTIDVECGQGREIIPLVPGMGEMAFLCGWTRCEAAAKFLGYPAWLMWKKLKIILTFEPGYQKVIVGEEILNIYTLIDRDLVFSLAYTGKL